jgi:hypothetical protein
MFPEMPWKKVELVTATATETVCHDLLCRRLCVFLITPDDECVIPTSTDYVVPPPRSVRSRTSELVTLTLHVASDKTRQTRRFHPYSPLHQLLHQPAYLIVNRLSTTTGK